MQILKKAIILPCFLVFLDYYAECQIYNKEIVYTFSYSFDKGGQITTGKIYLGCLGKVWPIKEQKQMAVIWTTDLKELADKVFNTGIIEDKDRIWLHPPRNGIFKILEYSPFPEIRFPVKLNKKWNWQLQLGEFWANKEFGLSAIDTLKFSYEISENQQIFRDFERMSIDCLKVNALSTNLRNRTGFIGLFNQNYGFVQMIFNNLDGSIVTLNLVGMDQWVKFAGKANNTFLQQGFPNYQ